MFDASSCSSKITFKDKVVAITGAGSGLGKSYALEFSKRGAKVIVNDFGGERDGSGIGSTDRADQVVSEIKNNGGSAVANYKNVATVRGGIDIVETALKSFGTLDILVNNAGIVRDKTLAKMASSDWKTVIDVHLNGAYNVTRPAFQVMKDKGSGKIIMTASAAGLYGNFGQVNYSAAKMALIGMMNSLKLECKKYNITVNTIAPISATRLTKDVMPDEIFSKAKPDLVTALVLYLCSDYCKDNGRIYNVGLGYVNRAIISTNPWTEIYGDKVDSIFENVHKRWGRINGIMEEMNEFSDISEMFSNLMTDFGKF